MEDLVRNHLSAPKEKLEVLVEKSLSGALEDFVDKSMISAISETTAEVLEEKQALLLNRKNNDVGDDASQTNDRNNDDAESTASNHEKHLKTSSVKPNSRNGGKARAKENKRKLNIDEDLDFSGDDEPRVSSRKQTKSSRKSSGKKAASAQEFSDDEIEDDDEVDEITFVRTSRSTRNTTSTKKKPPVRRARTSVKRKFDDSDSDDDFDDALPSGWGSAATRSQRSQY